MFAQAGRLWLKKDKNELALLAREVVRRTAQHVAAGLPSGDTADLLYRVISDYLPRTNAGRDAFERFCKNPADDSLVQRVVDLVRDGLERSDQFRVELQGAAARTGVIVANVNNNSNNSVQTGDVRGRDFVVGVSGTVVGARAKVRGDTTINLGGSGLASALLVAALLGGGAGVAGTKVIQSGPTVSLSQLVGTWEGKPDSGVPTVMGEAMSMTVDAKGNFKLSAIATMANQAIPLACNGFATADGDHFGLHASSGMCTLSSATLVRGGQALDITDGQGRGTVTLIKK
jgi:hypothetical protein